MDKEGINIELIRKGGCRESLAEFAVVRVPFMDLVFQLNRAFQLEEGDKLRLSFKVPVASKASGIVNTETHRYTEDWEYSTGVLKTPRTISYFRFTKIGQDAWLELLDEMPISLHTPDEEKAEKVR